MSINEVVIVSGARTAIGGFAGSLSGIEPTELGAIAAREAISRAGMEGADVGHVVMGNVTHTDPKDMYLSRVVGINAGIPKETPALTVNRLCGSGLQAVVSAAQTVMLGDADIALAGGAESMSRAGYMVPAVRMGQKMGSAEMIDMMLQALHDPFGHGHMGITAENLAKRHGITREEQDAFALESHQRAAHAINEGYFKDQIVPVEVKQRRETVVFDTDEHTRMNATLADMEKLRPAFIKDGTVTAGNASGINDAGAAVVLASSKEAERRGLKPMARIAGYGLAGVEPSEMGIGPVPSSKIALKKAGITIDDLDVIEANEAFAAQACSVNKVLGLDPAKVNPNGGAIALGHPVGASGTIVLIKALYELQRINGRYGLVTLCIGGGQGIAVVVERL